MLTGLAFAVSMMADSKSDSSKQQSTKHLSTRINGDEGTKDDTLSTTDLKEILDRLTREEIESKEVKQSVVRKLTADMTERGRKLGAHLESIHGYVVKDCTNLEDSQDQCLSEELADELRKRTTSVDTEIKQLENQVGQLQRTLVKGKVRRESLRHRMSVSSPKSGRKASAISSCSSTSEIEELTLEEYKAKIEMLENEKLEWTEDKKDLGDEIKFLKYQLQYRLEVQSLQNDNTVDKSESDKLMKENETLREENCNLKERLSTIKEKLKEKGNVEENLLSIADVSKESTSGVFSESEIERLNTERKILLSTIMRMQSLEKDDEDSPSFADFGVQVDLNKLETIEEDETTTPLVAKLTKENKALKKHITDMQKDLDDYEEERKSMSEENFTLIDEKRSLEDTINKLRTQMSDTLDTTLDEIEQLHAFNEDLEAKLKRTEAKFKELLQNTSDLQTKNCKSLESLVEEVERKTDTEEAFDYLDSEVKRLIDQNRSSLFRPTEEKIIEQSKEEKQFSSNLLNEVKSCKDLLESQRSHIRKLQLDKRDIEEGYTKMKRELLLLKSSKQRARENSKELQFLKKRRAKSLNDGAQEVKSTLLDKDSLQREVKRLGCVKAELENTVQKLKKENTTLEDEKVCLLGSLYHQLERNESLEMQIEELTVAIQQWETRSDLDSDVFSENKSVSSQETEEQSPLQECLDSNAIESDVRKSEDRDVNSNEIKPYSPNELEVEHASGRPTSPVVSVVGSAAEESMHEMKAKIHALGEQLKAVQESVIDLEAERENILEDLENSKKNEKELRNVIVQLKRENSIHEDKFTKSNELAETLQIRLKDAQNALDEIKESLEEANTEKEVSKKHCDVLDNRLREVTTQRDEYKKKTEHYNNYLKELYGCITEMVQSDSEESENRSSIESDESEQSEDEIESGIYNGFGLMQASINDIMKQLNEKNDLIATLHDQVNASHTEKEALHKSLRETDAKKKQLKGFITKLTEEKEKVNEQLDEMKQQKSNLADALENVYQSKEKLQNRLSEALCKQEQYKKSLAESIDEAKTLRESLYRMVNEHETMKESLLTANREVERLKSQHLLHTGKSAISVIKEEDEEERDQNVELKQYPEEQVNTNVNEKLPGSDFAADIFVKEVENTIPEIVLHLRNVLLSLSNENALFESQIKKLLRLVDKESMETVTEDDASGMPTTNISSDNKESKENSDVLFMCVSEKLSKDEDSFSLIHLQIAKLEKFIGEAKAKLHSVQKEQGDDEEILDLMRFQKDILTKKLDLDSKDVDDNKSLVEWFEAISVEKEILEKELKSASRENIKLLEDLNALREENEEIKLNQDAQNKATDIEQQISVDEKEVDSSQNEHDKEPNVGVLSNDLQNAKDDDIENLKEMDHDLSHSLEELDANQLRKLVKEYESKCNNLDAQMKEESDKRMHLSAMEMELEKSNTETKALEKQVEVLSKEGATLRGEADERVQRLIELEESMILTIEKKLELAEYAAMLTAKKDDLEKKCEELSREVQGLKASRDQILALKSQSDEKMCNELKELKQYKEKAMTEIEDLNDILRVGRQDFEAIKLELDSMHRKNRSLKEELERASAREEEITSNFQEKLSGALTLKSDSMDENSCAELELLKLKTQKLESDVSSASEKSAELEKHKDDLESHLNELINVYDARVKANVDTEESLKDVKISELKNWIITSSDVMENYNHMMEILESFVQEVEGNAPVPDVEISDGEKSKEFYKPMYDDDVIYSDSLENARGKLELLIQRLKESFQSQTNFQTQLGQIKEDNERITKELAVKSNFLKTMRDSFEQLLQERNLLARKARTSDGEEEIPVTEKGTHDPELVCQNCKELERERDELKLEMSSMNEYSAELNDKCLQLKENLLQLKQQKESIKNNNVPTDFSDESSTHSDEIVPQEIVGTCESAPTFESMIESKGEPSGPNSATLNENSVAQDDQDGDVSGSELQQMNNCEEGTAITPNDMNNQTERYREEIESLKDLNKQLEKDVALLNEKIKEIKHEHHRETTELKKEFQQQEQELGVLGKEKDERKKLISDLKNKIDDLKSISCQKKEFVAKPRKSNDDIEEESIKLQKMLAERSSSLKDLNEKLGVSKNFMQRILDENKNLKEDITSYELEQKEMKAEIEVLKAEIHLKKTALHELKDDKSNLESKKSRLEEDLASVKEQLKTRGLLLATLEKDKEAFKGSLRKTQLENVSLKKQYDLLQELADSGKQRQKDTEELVKKLKQSCNEMTENFEKVAAEKKVIEDSLNEQLQTERKMSEEYKETIASLEKCQSSAEKNLVGYKEKVQTLTRELRRDKSRRDREICSIKQENARLLGDEGRIQKELENLREHLDYERSKNNKLEDDLKSAIIHNLTLNNSLKEQSQEKDKTSKELEGNKIESKRLNTLTGDLKSKIANLDALLRATKDEKKFLSGEVEKVKEVNADLRLRLKESGEDKEELEDILVEMRDKRQKLHNEIDRVLTERDELEDQLFDLKKHFAKKLQMAVEDQKKTETVLVKATKQETDHQYELNRLQKQKSEIMEENSALKDDLEKTKKELISLLQSAQPQETDSTDNSNSNVQLKEPQQELLEKSQNEVELQKAQNESIKDKHAIQEEIIKEDVVTVVQSELQSCDKENEAQAQLSKLTDENLKLRAQQQETESKLSSLKDELFKVSKRQIQEECMYEVTKRKCNAVEEELSKSNVNLNKVRASLKVSNANLTDTQKRLRSAEANNKRLEDELKRLMLEKDVVEKVKVTSIEVPAASQVIGLEKAIPVAKAESLESARKEIAILEAQVKDFRDRTKQDRELTKQLLSDINIELIRASRILAMKSGHKQSINGHPDTPLSLSSDDLRDKLNSVRKTIDFLEHGCQNPSNGDSGLSDKLQFLEEKLTAILQEKQVLEDIGSSTRKELRSLVKSLSSEREEMRSLSTERSKMKVKLEQAEQQIKDLVKKVKSLREECAQLRDLNQRLGTASEPIVKPEVINAVQANPPQHELDLKKESKHLEMELMEQDRELQWLRHECKEITSSCDDLKNKCKKLEGEKSAIETTNKKIESHNHDLYAEVQRKERYLASYRKDNDKLLTIQRTSEAQIRHLNREIELFSDRVVCCETEKEQLEQVNQQLQNEIQELVIQKANDNVVREKLEKLFYENTKLTEQKKMLATRLQTLERDMKSQILTGRDLEAEKEELFDKIDKAENETRHEISKKERLAYLLDKHEKESRAKIDGLSRLVEKLKNDKDDLCAKHPRLDRIHQENNKLGKECEHKDTVINKLKDQNYSMKKEIDALRRSYDKLKESQRLLTSDQGTNNLSTEPPRHSPRLSRQSGSKTSSFSSFDRAPSSRASVSSDRRDSRNRTPPIRRSSSRRRDDRPPGEGGDISGGSSQECFCSPILSVVNLCPYDVQQTEEVDANGRCPVCKRRKNRKGTIKEHYV